MTVLNIAGFPGLSAIIYPRVPAPPPIKDAWDEYLERKDKVIICLVYSQKFFDLHTLYSFLFYETIFRRFDFLFCKLQFLQESRQRAAAPSSRRRRRSTRSTSYSSSSTSSESSSESSRSRSRSSSRDRNRSHRDKRRNDGREKHSLRRRE